MSASILSPSGLFPEQRRFWAQHPWAALRLSFAARRAPTGRVWWRGVYRCLLLPVEIHDGMVWVTRLMSLEVFTGSLPLGRLGPGQGHCFRSGVEGGETEGSHLQERGLMDGAVCRAGLKSGVLSLSFTPCPGRRLNQQL